MRPARSRGRRSSSRHLVFGAPSRTSNAGSSPRGPATASPRPGNAGAHRVDRHSTRTQFPPRRNSSRLDCPPLEPQNSSALAGQRLTESQKRSGDVETEGLRALRVILRTNLAMPPTRGGAPTSTRRSTSSGSTRWRWRTRRYCGQLEEAAEGVGQAHLPADPVPRATALPRRRSPPRVGRHEALRRRARRV